MNHKPQRYKQPASLKTKEGSFGLVSFDPIEQERLAQLHEHQRRQGQGAKKGVHNPRATSSKVSQQKPSSKTHPKPLSFEQNLERTYQWLEQTFPFLFSPQGPSKVLDAHILRDIKQHYKHQQEVFSKKDRYPENLVIKAALNRYMMSDHYLLQVREGARKYNLKGIECGVVTRGEEDKAIELLGLTPESRENG